MHAASEFEEVTVRFKQGIVVTGVVCAKRFVQSSLVLIHFAHSPLHESGIPDLRAARAALALDAA